MFMKLSQYVWSQIPNQRSSDRVTSNSKVGGFSVWEVINEKWKQKHSSDGKMFMALHTIRNPYQNDGNGKYGSKAIKEKEKQKTDCGNKRLWL